MSQNLSPFHAELLDFIKRDVAKKIAIDGFDEAADSELRAFLANMGSATSPTSFDDPFPLGEILDNYHYLFGSRGPLHLEKKLIAAFSLSSAKEERVRIYRGLPRCYRRDQPTESHIKRNFLSLPTLLRLGAEKSVFRLYGEKALPGEAKVTLFSWIIGDGWGDYIAGLEAIEILRRRFADLQLGWVVLFPKHLGSPFVPKGAKTHLIPYDRECLVSQIKGEALEILRTSDLILQIPTFFPEFDRLREAVDTIPCPTPPPTWHSIGEYGFLESKWFHPQTGNRSMGLHFLEKGVLVKSVSRQTEPSFSEVKSHELLQWLFNTATPGLDVIERYKNGHHFYLAYLTSPVGGAVYLHALAKAHERDKKGIDLCCPDIGWLIRHIETQTKAGLPVLEMDGISVELYFQGKMVPLIERAGGKKIRIFCPPTLTAADFHLLISLSGDWIAIRGDQSFSEAVSANKGFFFDGRDHARYFLKDLFALAENRICSHKSTMEVLRGMGKAFLHNLPLGSGEWVEETDFQEREPWQTIALNIGVALQDPDCLAGFKKLARIIAEEHAFNDFLSHFVQRELCHRADPKTALIEEESIRPFAEGRIALPQAILDLRNRLEQERK